MAPSDGWAGAAAALPQDARRQRERPFWTALIAHWGWRQVLDAGCGAGFHVALLGDLGVLAWGFDRALPALSVAPRGRVVAGDLVAPPSAGGRVDAVICLGNTFSLLSSRSEQRRALQNLGAAVRPGGVVILQGEDVGSLVADGPAVRTRRMDADTAHVRVFQRRGRRVQILGGVAPIGGEARLETGWMLPTAPADVGRMAATVALSPVELPLSPPGGATTWWVALERPPA